MRRRQRLAAHGVPRARRAPAREPRRPDARSRRRRRRDRAARRRTPASCRCCCRSAPRRRTATSATTACGRPRPSAGSSSGCTPGAGSATRRRRAASRAPTSRTTRQLADRRPGPRHEPRVSEGVFERFAGAEGRAARVRLRVAAVPALALRQGLEGACGARCRGSSAGRRSTCASTSASRPRPAAAADRPRGAGPDPDLMPVPRCSCTRATIRTATAAGSSRCSTCSTRTGGSAILAGNASALYGLGG